LQLNASENCIDRHLVDRANDVALIYEADNKADSYNVT
jgi:acetyl-CoA synthetase